MWSAFARFSLFLLLTGCQRQLDLSLALSTDSCTIGVPAGGSIEYHLTTASGSFCGGCLQVASALQPADIVPFLKAHAPACTIAPNAKLTVQLTAWSSANCPDDPSSRLFCSSSQPLTLPDGHDDAVAVAVLTCDPMCSGVCKPSTCMGLGKNCGSLSDGCNGMLNCGDTCVRPQRCGGGGVPNVCGK
jgi:hypothetical protein